MIIHSGKNDLTQEIDTIGNMKIAIEETWQEITGTEIVISRVLLRKNKRVLDKKLIVKELTRK